MSIRMSNEMRELRVKLGNALDAIDAAVAKGDAEAATKAKEEADRCRSLLTAAENAFEARRGLETDPNDETKTGNEEEKYNAALFYKAISGQKLTENELKIMESAALDYRNKYSEGSKKDGGYTVPDDLSTTIYESVKSKESVRNLISVENVSSVTGTRIWRSGDANKLYNTEEYEEVKEMNSAHFEPMTYKQHKYAGMMTVSTELLEDSFVSFEGEIRTWLSDAARVTENHEILYGVGGEKHCQGLISTSGAYTEVTTPSTLTIDFFRAVYLTLPAGYRAKAKWVMNSLAFAKCAEVKDGDGRSLLQPNPREKDSYLLLGFPVEIYDSILTDEDNKTVVMFGDFESAYRMFARKDFGIAFTDVGAGAFETDSLKARGMERFDGRIFDRAALIMIRGFSVSALTLTEAGATLSDDISEATLKNLTKTQLLELCAELEVTGVTESSTKNAIVTAILNKLNPAGEQQTETNPAQGSSD